MYTKSSQHLQAGMTLIEIMVVVVILGILAAIVVPNFLERPDQARVQRAKLDIKTLEGAVNLYKLDNFRYPTTDEGLGVLVGKGIDKIPKDPWNNNYQLLSPGVQGAFDIYSFGADGQAGGTGVNADIYNE